MKLLCRLGWHEYMRWEYKGDVVVSTKFADYPSLPPDEQTYEIQKRECVHCGIKKMRRERK